MPAYWLYLIVITSLMLGGYGAVSTHGGWTPHFYIGALWGYFVNYAPMGGIWEHQMLTIHLWSLAVEEQFYFLWPGICWLLLRRRAGSPMAAIFAWGAVLFVIVFRHLSPDSRLENLLPTRGMAIVIGAAVAFTLQSNAGARLRPILALRSLRVLVVSCILVIVAVFTLLVMKHRVDILFVHRYALPPLNFLFALLIAMLWYGPRDWLARVLSLRPIAYLGRISYGIYLYHLAAWFLVWGPLLGERISHWPKLPKFGLRVTVFFGLSIAIASASYYVLEKPFLRLKDRVR
jgi:peptidoglycan/LPS O-acetylase OafA/YrhL